MTDIAIETAVVVQLVEEYVLHELHDAAKFTNRAPLDESGIYDLHRVAARVYAAGWRDGERAAMERAHAQDQRGRERAVIDAAHLERQRKWSRKTFGPGERTAGVLDHITKEMEEIRSAPDDVTEWADLLILAFDGAWRAGHEPQAVIDAIKAKQSRNESREWPDWRTSDPNKAIEHVREVVS